MGNKKFRFGIRLLAKLVIEMSLVNADHQFWPVGESCTMTAKIVCFAGRFQQCASGAWSAQTELAAEDDCSILSANSMTAPTTMSSTIPLVGKRCMSQVYPSKTILQPTMIETATISENGGQQPVVQKNYSGPAANFPPESSWLTFDRLWDHNKAVCEKNPDGKAGIIHDDILQVAKETVVDARIIFAVVLQESTCLLALATTQGPIANAGLMQSHNGVGFTDDASILQMIRDGTNGTYDRPNGGDGLKQVIYKHNVYGGLRAYNSGDFGLNENDLSSANTGSPSYVSDIANRLTGAKIAS